MAKQTECQRSSMRVGGYEQNRRQYCALDKCACFDVDCPAHVFVKENRQDDGRTRLPVPY